MAFKIDCCPTQRPGVDECLRHDRCGGLCFFLCVSLSFFSHAFFRSVSVAIKGAPGTRVLQKKIGGQLPHLHAVFTEGSVLACTRRLPGRQPRPRGKWARSEKVTQVRARPIKVAQTRGGCQRRRAKLQRTTSQAIGGHKHFAGQGEGPPGGGEKRRPLTPSGLRALARSSG